MARYWTATFLPLAMLGWKATLIGAAGLDKFHFYGHDFMWCVLTTTLWGIAQHGGRVFRLPDGEAAGLVATLVLAFVAFTFLVLIGIDAHGLALWVARALGFALWAVCTLCVVHMVDARRRKQA